MNKTIINGVDNGCEFQNECIEYKDISYLKIMPICAIHELSIACHDKVNKCKYYKLYKQVKRLQEENEKLKREIKNNKTALQIELGAYNMECGNLLEENEELLDENKKYKQALEEIRSYCDEQNIKADYTACYCYITNKIDEVLNDNQ